MSPVGDVDDRTHPSLLICLQYASFLSHFLKDLFYDIISSSSAINRIYLSICRSCNTYPSYCIFLKKNNDMYIYEFLVCVFIRMMRHRIIQSLKSATLFHDVKRNRLLNALHVNVMNHNRGSWHVLVLNKIAEKITWQYSCMYACAQRACVYKSVFIFIVKWILLKQKVNHKWFKSSWMRYF